MNLYKKNIRLIFLASLAFTLFLPILFPSMRISAFIPFVVILFYRKPFYASLWGALCCGFILDLLSPHSRIGIYAINYTLTSAILYQQKRHFFADSISTLPIMTFFFAVISTIFQVILLCIFEKPLTLSFGWLIKDVILMPVLDSIFAFTVFILPFVIFGKPVRRGQDYFLQEGSE